MMVAVAGCVAQAEGAEIQRRAPWVDMVFGPQTYHQLPEMIARVNRGAGQMLNTEFPAQPKFDSLPQQGPSSGVSAFLSVQEGCDKFCTFCVVPYTRGAEYSRGVEAIIEEGLQLVVNGAREITLVGQTVNAYKEPATGADFADLLEEVCAIELVERVSFVSSHPKDLNEKLARVCATLPKMNPRFHLALQSGSNPMLRKMNRKYSIEEFLERIYSFKAHNPSWAMTTDLIVGFPGETEEDFQRTVDVCATGIFAQAYMFVYSPRRGTPAAVWHEKNPVPRDVAQDRFKRLVAVQDAAVRAYHDRKIGTTVRALIHGVSRKDATKLSAKTIDNVTVNFPMIEAVQDTARPWVDVQVEAASVWGVRGNCVGRAASYDGAAELVAPPVIDLLAV